MSTGWHSPSPSPPFKLNQVTSIQLYANGSSYLFSADSNRAEQKERC